MATLLEDRTGCACSETCEMLDLQVVFDFYTFSGVEMETGKVDSGFAGQQDGPAKPAACPRHR